VNQPKRQRESPGSGVIAKAKPKAGSPGTATGHRTLVIDFDTTGAGSVAGALRIAGHLVDMASTRAEALTLMKRRRYSLVVSNLRMPDLNGPTLYEELARYSPRMLPRVIFITESAFSSEYSKFLMEAGVPLLLQPVSAAELWDRIERLLLDARSDGGRRPGLPTPA
jgi:DNA-binding response OmpR family regulator